MFDKNKIDSGWLLWSHNYALGYWLYFIAKICNIVVLKVKETR